MKAETDGATALLTLDWVPPEGSRPAVDFVALAPPASEGRLVLGNCEALFERHPDGYRPLKELEQALPQLESAHPGREIRCHFNAFAYAFLKGAKNYDFLLLEERNSPFRQEEAHFRALLNELERFEQRGETFPASLDRETYFALREIFTRRSAREERWTAAELLVSGPATAQSLTAALGSHEPTIRRALHRYQALGVLSLDGEVACLSRLHLPLVYFFVRELMGIDPLELLV